jgi:3-oxoacyl-[acyl-carrier protein] reductase
LRTRFIIIITNNIPSGIGAAIAENLASKGANLVLNYTSDSSESLTNDLSKLLQDTHGISTLIVQADVSEKAGADHIINTAKNHFSHPKTGKFQIDILINNAGVAKDQRIPDIQIKDFERCYKINVLGPILLLQAAVDYLPHDRSGRIVNLSSVSSSEGFVGQSVYGGTKAALDAMTRTWSRELNNRATVNSVNPGPVATDMWAGTTAEFKKSLKPWVQTTPMAEIRPDVDDKAFVDDAEMAGGRPAYSSEIGGIVGMLCTPDSVWCTGQVVCANGGMVMR